MEFLAEAGIETPEEVEDITKVVDKETGEVGVCFAVISILFIYSFCERNTFAPR